jgi:hypothetical protein
MAVSARKADFTLGLEATGQLTNAYFTQVSTNSHMHNTSSSPVWGE